MKTKDYIINYANQMRAVLLTKCYEYETEYLIGWYANRQDLKEYKNFFIIDEFDEDERGWRYSISKEKNKLY